MQRRWSALPSVSLTSFAFIACSGWGDDAKIEQGAPAPSGLIPTLELPTLEATSADTTPQTSPTSSDPPPGSEPASSGGGISSSGTGGSATAPASGGDCELSEAAACAEVDGSGGSSTGGSSSSAGGSTSTGGSSSSAGGSSSGGSSSEPRPLPDLVLDGQYMTATIRQDFVDAAADTCLFNEGCVTGTGLRRVIRFGTRSGNIGTADLVVGKPDIENALWEFDACHQHFHFEGYAQYSLIDSTSGTVLPIGVKNGFCLRDQETWDPELAAGNCAGYDCNFQGLSLGCADVYRSDLDCQWVDITGLPAGPYELLVTVNSEQTIDELSLANNSASVRVEITADTVRVLP